MRQLVYISVARPGISRIDIDQILVASRRHNSQNRITGLLVHDNRRFLQALEGDRAVVDQLFMAIRGDRRHQAIQLLSLREVRAREFGDWAMASHLAGGVPGDADLVETIDALTVTLVDAGARTGFRNLARLQRRAA